MAKLNWRSMVNILKSCHQDHPHFRITNRPNQKRCLLISIDTPYRYFQGNIRWNKGDLVKCVIFVSLDKKIIP